MKVQEKQIQDLKIPKGYKQTEVGVIPDDWILTNLLNISTEIFLGLTSKVFYVPSGGIPLIRAGDIASGRLKFTNVKNISLEQHKFLTKYRRAEYGDILISKSGSLGTCALVDSRREFSVYESIIVIKLKRNIKSKFILQLLRDSSTQKRLINW